MTRREFPAKVKVAAYKRAAGACEGCRASLMPGRFHYDHIIPDALGGEPTLDNCAVLCRACHAAKTAEKDIPQIAKAKRVHAKHVGAHQPRSRLPGGRGDKFKRKIGGGVVPRHED